MHLALTGALDGVLTAGIYALMASGLTLVFGVMQIINLAQAAFVILGAYLSYTVERHLHVDLFAGLVVTVPVMFLLGVAVERLLIARLREERELMSLLMTFALAIIVEGALNVIFGADYIKLRAPYVDRTLSVLGFHVAEIYLYAFAMSVALLAGLYALLYRTTFGRTVRASMENPLGARLIGVDFARVSMLTFGIGTALAAAGGMAFGATESVDAASMYDLMPALLAIVILGGLGSVAGVLVASIVILVAEDVTAVLWTPVWATTVSYVVLAAVLLLRPRGLFGRAEARAQ